MKFWLNLLDQFVEVLVPEMATIALRSIRPHWDDVFFDGAERFVFRNAGIRHTAHALFKNLSVVIFREITVFRKIFVAVVSN